MKYLLIDFGASSIKSVIYDKEKDLYYNNNKTQSPFINSSRLSKLELINILNSIVKQNQDFDAIVPCTILGGYYEGDTYVSWKEKQLKKNYCLISGLFSETPLFHVHYHHEKQTAQANCENRLKILGYIKDKPVYSSLGDTPCAINSIDISDSDVVINMGTGSQVIYKKNGDLITHSFIPAGRSFLAINNFYKSIGLDFFEVVDNFTVKDVLDSTLSVDLNIFEQSRSYKNGGAILNIKESNFTIDNLTCSIIKSFAHQYLDFIQESQKKNLIVIGGIQKKSKLIKGVFSSLFEKYNPFFDESEIENTHRGIAKYIKEFL